MYDVVMLTLARGEEDSTGCGTGGDCCSSATPAGRADCADTPRVPVLACADALTSQGARVEFVTARSDREIDAVLARLDGPPRPDGLDWPDPDGKTRLVVATASNAQLRAVMRRLVRRYAPPPSRRPADLADNRTLPDLPAIGVLPLDPSRSGDPGRLAGSGPTAAPESPGDLAGQLGLPRAPAAVAAALLDGRVRRLDLLRNDAGSVTLDGALLGAANEAGTPLAWRGRVEVDDTVLTGGDDPLLACVVGNAGGYAELTGVRLLSTADPADGTVEVAVALPVLARSRWGRRTMRIEVRRARGRAVAVTPRDPEVPFLDDGVPGTLSRKRSWWIEPGAWAVYDR
ncbi:hypothetical protein ACN27G_30315 [Plantactinospora sp. WMMB334]|uniref:hypothetical protein n=1 Tax=Plantactinospora sp. WMMB334 TaxID=3404119 RepID=UPI003B952A98